MNAGRIAEDGSVDLSFSHASDYVIVIGEDMTPATVTNPTKKAVKTNDSNDMERMIMIMLIGAACLTTVGIYRKKTYR